MIHVVTIGIAFLHPLSGHRFPETLAGIQKSSAMESSVGGIE